MRTMLAAILVTVLALTTSVSAQEAKKARPNPHDGILRLLLDDATVKTKFDLTDDQIKKIADFDKEFRAGNEGKNPMERRKAMQEGLKGILSPAQMKNVEVLRFQLAGGLEGNFSLDSAAVALGLKKEQREKIKSLLDERTAKAKEINAGTDKKENRAKVKELYKETREKIEAILTPAEREKAEKLTQEGKIFQEKFLGGNVGAKEEHKAEGKKGEGKRGEGKKGKK